MCQKGHDVLKVHGHKSSVRKQINGVSAHDQNMITEKANDLGCMGARSAPVTSMSGNSSAICIALQPSRRAVFSMRIYAEFAWNMKLTIVRLQSLYPILVFSFFLER